VIYLDTHAVMAVYQNELGAFSSKVSAAINSDDDIRISPMVLLELQFLHEIKRIYPSARQVVSALAADVNLRVCGLPFAEVAQAAMAEHWTRDPFDRLIVAQARLAQAALVTKDRSIRRHYAATIS
jgi:PIN domain nuclease of toxin-antitoxin system